MAVILGDRGVLRGLGRAGALHEGQISVVQPLLVIELVFALALRRIWLRQSIRGITWWAGAVTCVSLGVFLAVSERRWRGHPGWRRAGD